MSGTRRRSAQHVIVCPPGPHIHGTTGKFQVWCLSLMPYHRFLLQGTGVGGQLSSAVTSKEGSCPEGWAWILHTRSWQTGRGFQRCPALDRWSGLRWGVDGAAGPSCCPPRAILTLLGLPSAHQLSPPVESGCTAGNPPCFQLHQPDKAQAVIPGCVLSSVEAPRGLGRTQPQGL